ncbi:MAG: ChbG/HpnK family deacetylase [Planctomycetaceae bacterium]
MEWKLIVNADDLGHSAAVNEEIFARMAQGSVSSATLLANGEAIDESLHRLRQFPNHSFGVHLNLTEFRPLSEHPDLAPILDNDGRFATDPRTILLSQALKDAIFAEWSAQIERIQKADVTISHVDSHHHVHTTPALFRVLKKIQQRFGFSRVRNTRNVYHAGEVLGLSLKLKKRLWSLGLCRLRPKTITTRHFTDLSAFCKCGREGLLPAGSTCELMVHPGPNEDPEERQLLDDCPLSMDATVDWNGISCRLVNFQQLC